MGRKCRVAGCHTSVGLHLFPQNLEIRRQWLRAIGLAEDFKLPPQAGICKQHFSRDSFANSMEVEMGYASLLRLNSDSVPTLAIPRRSLHPPTLLPRQPASVRRQSERMTREIGCQTDRVIARHANVQANVKLSRRSQGCQTLFPSPSLNVNQDIPETPQIKEEPEEQCIKQEEEQLQEPVVEPKVECVKIEPSMFQQTEDSMEIKEEDINADSFEPGNYEPMVECVKIEPSMFQQTEDSKEIKGEDINADSSEPGNHDDWRSSLSCADVELEADGEDFHKDQITAESMTAHNTSQSSNFQSAAETSAAVNPGDMCTEARGEGKKRYQCVFCPKSFSRILLLQNHITTHTGDKPFSCPSCDKTFTFRADLEGHIRMHTGEKPFSCSHCDKLFAQQRSLTQHLKTHTSDKPYNCPLCSKTFSLKGNLTLHMRKHTGEKPFSCAVCEEAFYCKSNLEEHSRSHTEKL